MHSEIDWDLESEICSITGTDAADNSDSTEIESAIKCTTDKFEEKVEEIILL